jgi:hypothetical protein
VERALLWSLRVLWVSIPLSVGTGIARALAGTSPPVHTVSAAGLWVLWGVGVVVLLVPSTPALTALRLVAPAVPVVAVAAVVAEPEAVTVIGLAVALAVATVAFTAEVGHAFVQGSAYGDERRFLLRPPGALVLGPIEVLWAVSVGALGTGIVLLAARAWVAGGVLVGIGAVTTLPVVRRLHRLSRRFVVLVPAGLVLHDHLVLAETLMVPRGQVTGLSFALEDTEAADLTGGALGRAVEVRFADLETVVLAAPPRAERTRALHARAVLVSPSRPGSLLESAATRV